MDMKSGKRVLGIMIVSLLLVSSISLVSAGFWSDLFGFGDQGDGLEGELESGTAASPASVTITGTLPPEIVAIENLLSLQPLEGTVTNTTFDILVWHPSGRGALNGTGQTIGYGVSSSVQARIKNLNRGYIRASDDADFTTHSAVVSGGCQFISDTETLPWLYTSECCAGSNPISNALVVRYRCTVPIWYFDDYDPAGDVWKLEVNITDIYGNPECNTGVCLNNLTNITAYSVQQMYSYHLEGDTLATDPALNWTGTTIKGDLNQVNDDGASPNPFSVYSTGNMDTTSLIVNGTDLPTIDGPAGSYVNVSWFRFKSHNVEGDSCTLGDQLVNNSEISSNLVIAYDLSVKGTSGTEDDRRDGATSNETEFCLTDLINTASNPVGQGAYKTARSWIIRGYQY